MVPLAVEVGVNAPEAECATVRDRAPVTVVDAEAHRVVLLVRVPEGLVLRERVTVTDAELHCDVEREREGLLLWLGECVALTLLLALKEPLPLKETLALAEALN